MQVSSNSLFIKKITIYCVLIPWVTRSCRLVLNSIVFCIFCAFLSSPGFASPTTSAIESDRFISGPNKSENSQHTASLLVTTRYDKNSNDAKNSQSEIGNNANNSVDNKSHTITETTLESHNKAGNGLYSVNQYDQMLRRVVSENTKSKTTDKNSDDIWSDIRKGFQLKGYEKARVDSELEWFAKSQRYVDRVTTRATPYIYFVLDEVKQRDMPTEIALLPIVESAYLPFAFSSSQAAGLWQFIAETGKHYGLELNWWYDGRRDVYRSTLAALDFLLDLYARFDRDWLLALAAYNSGPGTVDRAIRQNLKKDKPTDFWSLRLPKETRDYVPKLLAISALIADPKAYNINLESIPNEPYFKRVHIKKQIDLTLAAKLANVSVEELYTINPSFNRWVTPPQGPHHLLIPIGSATTFQQNLTDLKPEDWPQWKKHQPQPQETLQNIATKYKTTSAVLKKFNNLKSTKISTGNALIVPNNIKLAALSHPKKPNKITHIVKQDESLWEISRSYNVRQSDLVKWNKMDHGSVLKPGQKLVILSNPKKRKLAKKPKSTVQPNKRLTKATSQNGSVKRVNYEVRHGDSLPGLSSKFNVTINQIRRWNEMDKGQFLTPGQNIRVYLHAPIAQNNI